MQTADFRSLLISAGPLGVRLAIVTIGWPPDYSTALAVEEGEAGR